MDARRLCRDACVNSTHACSSSRIAFAANGERGPRVTIVPNTTAALNACVHVSHTRAQSAGCIAKWSRIVRRIVADARYAARNDAAYGLFSGFAGCSMIACAKKLRWMYRRTMSLN